jgi:hypothetical protein
MPQADQNFNFTDLRGGRNRNDPPEDVDANQVLEALNVDYAEGQIAHRRNGSSASPGLGFVSGGPWNAIVTSWTRYLPDFFEKNAELWAVDGSGMVARIKASTLWAQMAMKTPFVDETSRVNWVTFNEKLFIFGPTGVNRSQVWDGTQVRYMGLAPPGPPVLAAAPAGNVTDTRRYWASVVQKTAAGVVIRRSELSHDYVELTPNAQDVTVVPTVYPGEGETHWELWGASKQDSYGIQHFVGDAVIGVGVTDSGALIGRSPAPIGTYLLPPAARYCVADGDRLILGGIQATAPAAGFAEVPGKISRIWYTPRLGSLDVSDDERIPITVGNASIPAIRNYLDITEPLSGLGGPVQGSFFAFAYRRTYRLSPTGDVTRPYTRVPLGVPYGCIHDKSVCLAEDESGNSALYVCGHKGPWRIDNNGPVQCNWDIQDVWATVNMEATIPCHTIYHADLHQLWVYIATGAANVPNERLVFDTRQGRRHATKGVIYGWTRAQGISTNAYCSVMFATTMGATMSKVLSPYASYSGGSLLLKCDDPATVDDVGNPYQAYIQKVLVPPAANRTRVGNAWALVKAQAGVNLASAITPDWGIMPAKIIPASFAPKATESWAWREFEDSAYGDIQESVIAYIGDTGPVSGPAWTIDRWQILVGNEGSR